MAGPFEFLHIKGRTEGSSNELSFDVLDAARSDMEKQKDKSVRIPSGSLKDKGSYHGVTGTATFSASPEVIRRKKQRRAHFVRTLIAAILVVVVFAGAGAFFIYQHMTNKNDFNGRYNTLIERLIELDSSMMEIDALMQNPVDMVDIHASSEQGENASSSASEKISAPVTLSDALVMLPSIKRELNSIAAESQSMKQTATQDGEKAALSHLETASKARLEMVEAAEKATDIASRATKRVAAVNDVWNKVIDADSIAREATILANEADTDEKTIEAREETEKAREMLIEAKEKLLEQESAKPNISFSEEAKYLDKRIEALQEAIKTANYLVIRNRDGAASANDSYNKADKEAASLALKLPDSEGDKVAELYRVELEKEGDEYENARAAASTADSAIRSFKEKA